MSIRDLRRASAIQIRLCVQEVLSNRTRFFLSTLGLFIGVSTFLVIMSFVRGLRGDLLSRMERIGGSNIVTVVKREPADDGEGLAFSRSEGLHLREMDELARTVPGVQAVLKQHTIGWIGLSSGGKEANAVAKGVGPYHLRTYNYLIREGRGLDAGDEREMRNVCLLGAEPARKLFGSDKGIVGRTLTVDGVEFEIVGLIESYSSMDVRSRELLMPHSAWLKYFPRAEASLSEAAVLLEDGADAKVVGDRIAGSLIRMHRGVNDIKIEANSEKLKELETASLGTEILLWTVAVITMAVSGISIMNIMFATIGNRIREIGLRKALGATFGEILAQFTLEAVLVCLLGSLPGLAAGSLVTLFPAGSFPFTPTLEPLDFFMAIGFAMVMGLLSGLMPALKAARMRPVDALRH